MVSERCFAVMCSAGRGGVMRRSGGGFAERQTAAIRPGLLPELRLAALQLQSGAGLRPAGSCRGHEVLRVRVLVHRQ